MGVTEDYKLSIYQDYGQLDEKEHIRLVRNKKTGQICVKKIVDYTQQDVVKFRQKSSSQYFPKLYEVISDSDKLVVVEEYINGVTLEEYMMGEQLPEEVAVKIAEQVCQALLELHSSTPMIVYRDLKTENIMITSEGNVKLIDFNISRSFQDGKKRDTVLLGTAEYAAPEQFGYFQTDNRTDIYAFGILFNYMLTGKYPIDGIAEGKYARMIQKCIELEPSKRYQSVEELLDNLSEKKADKGDIEIDMSISWNIPGFRSNVLWKKILAVTGYIFIFYMGLTIEFTQDGVAYPLAIQWINRVLLTGAQLFTVFFCSNYRGISNQFMLYRHRFIIVRVLSYVATWFFFFVLAIILSGAIETIIGF